jgi:hypothetical protein
MYPLVFSLLVLLFFSFIITAVLRRFITPLRDRKKLSNFLSSLTSFIILGLGDILLSPAPVKNYFDAFFSSIFISSLIVVIAIMLAFISNELIDKFNFINRFKIGGLLAAILILVGFFYPRETGYTHLGDPYVLQKKSCMCIGLKASKPDIDMIKEYCFGIPYSCSSVNEPKSMPGIGIDNPPQETSHCGADQGYYDTNISKCFGKTVTLISTLSLEEKDGKNVYFLDNPQWGDRNRLNSDERKIYVEFQKEINIQYYLKSQVKLIGKVDNKEPTPFKCTGVSDEQIIWSEKYPNSDYCIIQNEPWKIIVAVDQIERYVPPETWSWVDESKDRAVKLKSKNVVDNDVTKTARFIPMPPILGSDPDCIFLDNEDIKRKFKEIVLAGTEHGSLDEYLISNIEMTANGSLEKRVYDYGPCCKCPPGVYCNCSPCGEHTHECLNPKTLERKIDDGLKYGVNWFAGFITDPNLPKKSLSPYNDIKYYLQNYNYPLVRVKDETGKIIKTYEKMMFLHSKYPGDFLYQITFNYILVFKNENFYPTRRDVFDCPIKLKVYGEIIKAEYCTRPLKGQEDCIPRSLILVEKIIDENGENIISTK